MIKKFVKNFNDSVGVAQNSTFAKQLWVIIPVFLLVVLLTVLIFNHYGDFTWDGFLAGFNQEFLIFFAIGIFAQMVDGTPLLALALWFQRHLLRPEFQVHLLD